MILIRDVTVEFAGRTPDHTRALDRFSGEFEAGEWVAVTGGNGSGKTTLLHVVAGLITPSRGRIEFAQGQRPRVALLLQDPDNQFITTTARNELAVSPPPGTDGDRVSARIEEAVVRFDLGHLVDRNPHRLSGGEKQRLALATVWLQEPEVLLLDEPSAYLDADGRRMCLDFVSDLHRGGTTVFWATPGGEELAAAGRVVCLDSGRQVFTGTVAGLYAWSRAKSFGLVDPPLWELADTIRNRLFPGGATGCLPAGPVGEAAELAGQIAAVARAADAGGETPAAADAPPLPAGRPATPVVTLRSADFAYEDRPVLKSVSTRVDPGDCVGIAGGNGAGKSTLLGLLAGVHNPTRGVREAVFDRFAAGGRQNVFYLFQFPERLFFAETVEEEIYFGLQRLGLPAPAREERCREALDAVGLEPGVYLSREPLTLSQGEMRRVAFAIAVSLRPELLLLDEPNSCLDLPGRRILEKIVEERRSRGGTTVIASHDVSFLVTLCDRIEWMIDGATGPSVNCPGGVLPPGTVWPGRPFSVIEVQDELEKAGLNITPRALTPSGLADRLTATRSA